MILFAVWCLAGALIGAAANFLMRGDDGAGVYANVLLGVALALVGAWFAAPWIAPGIAMPRLIGLGAIPAALAGAVLGLAAADLVRRRR